MKILNVFLLAVFGFYANAQITISEILFNAPSWGDNVQYVELYNYSDNPVNIAEWSISGDVNLPFFPDVELQPEEYYLIGSKSLGLFDFGIVMVGWNPSEQLWSRPFLLLRDPSGNEIARIDYEENSDWPVPQKGQSIELCDAMSDTNDGTNWRLPDSHLSVNGKVLIGTPLSKNSCAQTSSSSEQTIDLFTYTLFPNPVENNVYLTNAASITKFAIYDSKGSKIMSGNDADNINISNLQSGAYVLLFTNEKHTYNRKFIKR